MTKRDKEFLLYLVELADKTYDGNSDNCTLTFEKKMVLFSSAI